MREFYKRLIGLWRKGFDLRLVFGCSILIGVLSTSAAFPAQIANTQTLKAEMIEQLGFDYFSQQEPMTSEDKKIIIDYKGGDLVLPMGSLDFNIKMTQVNQNATRIPLLMTINVDGIFRRGLWMTAQIKTYSDIVKPRRPIQVGTVLSKNDVVIERSLVDPSAYNIAMRLDDVLGFKTLRGLSAGAPIKLTHLVRAPLVKRGDRVLIIAKRGPMKITTPGIVREKGFKGSMVGVENIESKKMVYGQVVNSTMVQVDF